jgi:hypothetical protein
VVAWLSGGTERADELRAVELPVDGAGVTAVDPAERVTVEQDHATPTVSIDELPVADKQH